MSGPPHRPAPGWVPTRTRPTWAGGAGSWRRGSSTGSPSRAAGAGSTSAAAPVRSARRSWRAARPAERRRRRSVAPFVAHAATQVPDARASFRKGDAQHLPVDDGSFDAVVSGLVLNFVPDQPAALREMRRAARPGGVVAAYVWDYAERHAADGALLGRRRRGGSRGGRPATRTAFRHVPAGSAARAVPRRRSRGRRRGGDRRPRRSSPTSTTTGRRSSAGRAGAGLRDVASRRATERRCGSRCARGCPVEDDGSIRLTARAWAVRGSLAQA